MRLLAIVLLGAALPLAGQPGRKGGPPAEAVERFAAMTPEERREALRRLPPRRREMMERRLEQWQRMSPEQRQRLGGAYARFQEMSPEKQEEVRQLFRRFSDTFAPARRQTAMMAIRRLRRAGPGERQEILASRRFHDLFTESERRLIEQMAIELPEER